MSSKLEWEKRLKKAIDQPVFNFLWSICGSPRITGCWIPRAPMKGFWWHLHVGSSLISFSFRRQLQFHMRCACWCPRFLKTHPWLRQFYFTIIWTCCSISFRFHIFCYQQHSNQMSFMRHRSLTISILIFIHLERC